MNATVQDLAARYSALPASIRNQCPRPTVAVTPEKVRAWLVELRDTCLTAAGATTARALNAAHAGDLAAAAALKHDARSTLSFAAAIGDLIGYPPIDADNRSEENN